MILKRVGIFSAGKVMGAIMAAVGFIAGAFVTLWALAGAGMLQAAQGGNVVLPGMFLGVAAIIVLPIFYGIMGFIMGIIYAALYNAAAGMFGGLEIDLEPPSGTTYAL